MYRKGPRERLSVLARPPTRSSYLWVQVPLNIPPLEGHHGHVQETHVRPEPLANLHVPRGCPLMFMPGDGHQPSADSIGQKHEGAQDSNAKDGLHLLSIMACAVGCICYIRGEHSQGAPRMVVLLNLYTPEQECVCNRFRVPQRKDFCNPSPRTRFKNQFSSTSSRAKTSCLRDRLSRIPGTKTRFRQRERRGST